MSIADLRAEADRRVTDAITEGLEQFANGWTPAEVLVVLTDAADAADELRLDLFAPLLWKEACNHQSEDHPDLRCYLLPGHKTNQHLYTVKITRRAA